MDNINIKVNCKMSDTEAALRSRLLRRNAENAKLQNELDSAYLVIAQLSDELCSAKKQLSKALDTNQMLNSKVTSLENALNSYCIAVYLK